MAVLTFSSLVWLGLSLSVVFVLQKLIEFRHRIKQMDGHPGVRFALGLATVLGNTLPKIPYVSPGRNFLFKAKHDIFQSFGWDIITYVSAYPSRSSILIADAGIIKDVSSSRSKFPKPVETYKVLTFFGKNIVASEGEEWKKYRKIAAPAFSDRNNRLVWDETVQIMDGLFATVWSDQKQIVSDHVGDITLPIALFVIGVAGFGRRISWQDDVVIPPGHQMTFKDSLHVVSSDVFLKLIVPDWFPAITERVRKVRLAFKELDAYMLEMINNRRHAEKKEERYDLFSSLLAASDDPDDPDTLTDREVIGNIFIFLLAGHETTAHTLCFTFAMLALYPDIQEELHQHIKSVLSDGRLPAYDNMPLLTYSNAVFYETLRMFPPVVAIPKRAAEDTILVATNEAGDKKSVPVPQGTPITFAIAALHYNERYWKNPYEFNPSRFLGDWPRDAFVPFSAGPRACIGRKFFETEGIAILTMLVLKYKITVKEEPEFADETLAERQARITNSKPGLTLTPIRTPLVFTKRN